MGKRLLWRGRLTFVGNEESAPFPSMVVYFGVNHSRFERVFGAHGSLWRRQQWRRQHA